MFEQCKTYVRFFFISLLTYERVFVIIIFRTNVRTQEREVFFMKQILQSRQMNKNIYLMMVGAVLAGFITIALLITPIVKANGSSNIKREQNVKSIQIKTGDTLWSIAEKYYSPEYDSINAYVNDIKECNNISSDTIHAGNYLIVPYYN